VAIRVQPADAAVLIDGEPWSSPAGADRLVVHLAPGTHRVEIRKDGFDAFVTAFEIRRGETTVLNVSLARFCDAAHTPSTVAPCRRARGGLPLRGVAARRRGWR
jgi:hypothetical protein